MAIVYQHRRRDTNEVFYVGIGKFENRAYTLKSRNRHWIYIANKVGWDVDILFEGITWKDACTIEKGLIADIGRKDLGLGPLVNMTDGGDGVIGHHQDEATRKKISEASKKSMTGRKPSEESLAKRRKPRSEETKKKISESSKGRTAPNKGIPMKEEQKLKISNTLKNNPNRHWLNKTRSEETKLKISNTLKQKNKDYE